MNKKMKQSINYNLIAIFSVWSLSAVALELVVESPDVDFRYGTLEANTDNIAPASETPLVLSTRHPDSAGRGNLNEGGLSLANRLAERLGITPAQGEAGAGSIFRYAKLKLKAEEFQVIHDKIPDMDRLLIAGPNTRTPEDFVDGDPEDLGLAAQLLKDDFDQFGLAPDMLEKFIPLILEYVESWGGKPSGTLLQNALQGI